jgi:electron transport complex protein RnfC
MAIEGLVGSDLEEALRSLGVDLPIAPPPGEPAIISALVPEPGLDCAWVLWEDQLATLKAGAAVLRRLWPDGEFIEVVSPRSAPLGLGRLARCSERYPYTLPPLVKRKILGTWDPLARGMVEPSDLWAIGSVARSGLPLTSAPITIQYSSYLAPFGVRVSEALSQMNLSPLPGDVVVLGGLVRGRPTARLEMGLSKSTKALHLIRSSSLIDSYGLCLGCGRCAASCPLELPMDLLAQAPVNQWPETASRYSELLSGCLACGACALACPSSRPLLSLALMTKRTDCDDAARRQIGTACESPLS